MTKKDNLIKRFLLEHYAISTRDKGILMVIKTRAKLNEKNYAINNDAIPGSIDLIWLIGGKTIGIRLFYFDDLMNKAEKKFDENFLKQTKSSGLIANVPISQFEKFLINTIQKIKNEQKN